MSFKPYLNQDYNAIKAQLLRNGQLFEDPEFRASDESIYKFDRSQYVNYMKGIRSIGWKRPRELVSRPKFLVNAMNPKDIYQGGTLGNCWFIAGASCVAANPKYIQVNVPSDQDFDKDYCGIFHFRFWQYGEWYDVVIDDRLPVNPDDNSLLFASNKAAKDEFWTSLIEKAYAKLATCYEFLDGGFTHDALVDLTAGVTECFDIDTEKQSAEMFWKFIYQVFVIRIIEEYVYRMSKTVYIII